MILKKITFSNYRNIHDCTVDFNEKYIYLVGQNAQGKTNFLEAIYVLAYGSSFRTRNLQQLAKEESKFFSLSAELIDEDNLTHTLSLIWNEGNKEIYFDKKKINDRKELVYISPAVIFLHNDFQLVNGSQEQKRVFFDQILVYGGHLYIDCLRKYKKILILRNSALKNNNIDILDIYDNKLAEYGLEIIKQREKIISYCSKRIQNDIHEITDDTMDVGIKYLPSWKSDSAHEDILAILYKGREMDIMYKITKKGPHCDRIQFLVNGHDANRVASTGQIRLISLALKLTQARIIVDTIGTAPALLFDDVLLELDSKNEQGILDQLPKTGQFFFTLLDDTIIKKSTDELQRFTVRDGRIY